MTITVGITGSTGSLGREIIKSGLGFKYSFFKGDIRNKNKISKWISNKNLDAVIHLAAIVPIKVVNKNRKKAYEVNYLATKNLVDEVKKIKLNGFFASTSHVYSSKTKKISENSTLAPISYYGQTKLLAEKYIKKQFQKSNTIYCIGRIFSTTNKIKKIII